MKRKNCGKVKVRRTWKVRPVSKVKESEKLYRRHREKSRIKKSLKADGLE